MDKADSFINWGFAPSKQASGWVLVETGNTFWEDMRMRDFHFPYVRCYSTEDYKQKIIDTIYDEVYQYLYERDNLTYNLLEYFDDDDEHPIYTPIEIKIFNEYYELPLDCDFWFPQLALEGRFDNIREKLINNEDDWLRRGIKRYYESVFDLKVKGEPKFEGMTVGDFLMQQKINDAINTSYYYPISVVETGYRNDYQVNQTVLYLERIRGEN
jgi:hypothetical protein